MTRKITEYRTFLKNYFNIISSIVGKYTHDSLENITKCQKLFEISC